MTLSEAQAELVDELAELGSWKEKFDYIVEVAKEVEMPFPESQKIDENKVSGCVSQVWLISSLKDGKITYAADSDAVFVRGLVQILVNIYSGHGAEEIANSSAEFLKTSGLLQNLTPSRSNGVASVVGTIVLHAKRALAQNNA